MGRERQKWLERGGASINVPLSQSVGLSEAPLLSCGSLRNSVYTDSSGFAEETALGHAPTEKCPYGANGTTAATATAGPYRRLREYEHKRVRSALH